MITEFQGKFRWLSNFWPCEVIFNGVKFPSVENAYQAAKSSNLDSFISITPGQAKRLGRRFPIRPDWEQVKVSIMEDLLRQKFSQEPFRTQLINTGDILIQEGNTWGDKFWGVCLKTNKGENTLGKLIMKIRSELNENLNFI